MSITSRTLGSILFSLVLLSGSAWAAPTIQGNVKGPGGKPLQGAEVRLQSKDKKEASKVAKTDQQGRYTFNNLAAGSSYDVNVTANGMAATSAQNVVATTRGAISVNFSLKNQTGTAANGAPAKKKARKLVYIPPETGSNLGGRWVEQDDTAGADNVQKGGNALVRSLQMGNR